ncbi:hypothetical protein C1N70_04920 [Cytobacillus firmus]
MPGTYINWCRAFFYRSLTGSKAPTSKTQRNQSRISGGQTARKGPIGSTNNQWGIRKTPTD